jgi:hypothetical protein
MDQKYTVGEEAIPKPGGDGQNRKWALPGQTVTGGEVANDQKGVDYLVRIGKMSPVAIAPVIEEPDTSPDKSEDKSDTSPDKSASGDDKSKVGAGDKKPA